MAAARGGVGVRLETLEPRWELIIVAAAGPSLTEDVAKICRGHPTIAIKQAALRMPWASAVYACNAWQWQTWGGFSGFEGERWSLYHPTLDRKDWVVKEYGLRLVRGEANWVTPFSTDPSIVHYGKCSGFAAIGFAIHWLWKPGRIVLVGYDFREVNGRKYWNGPHPRGNAGGQFQSYMPCFEEAAKHLPEGVDIVNATPDSVLRCFPPMDLAEAVRC